MFDLMMPLANLDSTPAGPGAASAPAGSPPAAAPVAPVTGQAATGQAGAGQPGMVATSQGAGEGAATQKVAAAPVEKSSSPFSGLLGMAPIILMLVALYFFMMRGQKKEEKRRKNLLSEMKKGDKVQTIGGMVARVVSIDGDEVVLKVDESNNVKAVFKKSAILNVIVAGDEKAK